MIKNKWKIKSFVPSVIKKWKFTGLTSTSSSLKPITVRAFLTIFQSLRSLMELTLGQLPWKRENTHKTWWGEHLRQSPQRRGVRKWLFAGKHRVNSDVNTYLHKHTECFCSAAAGESVFMFVLTCVCACVCEGEFSWWRKTHNYPRRKHGELVRLPWPDTGTAAGSSPGRGASAGPPLLPQLADRRCESSSRRGSGGPLWTSPAGSWWCVPQRAHPVDGTEAMDKGESRKRTGGGWGTEEPCGVKSTCRFHRGESCCVPTKWTQQQTTKGQFDFCHKWQIYPAAGLWALWQEKGI